MPASPRSPKLTPDEKTRDALMTLAEALLDDFFLDDRNLKKYKRLVRGGRGVTKGERQELAAFDLSDRGECRLSLRAGSPEITITLRHPKFQARVDAFYAPEEAELKGGGVTELTGDRNKARRTADRWFDELTESLGLSGDNEDLVRMLMDALESSPEAAAARGDEPPPLTSHDRARIQARAEAIAREIRRERPGLEAHKSEVDALDDRPLALWPIMDGMVAACTATPRDESLVQAWDFLLRQQLTFIRYRIDAGWSWARDMVEEYQRKLLALGEESRLEPPDFVTMADALVEAGIAVRPEIKTAFADAGLTSPADVPPAELMGMVRDLMDELARVASNPFDIESALNQSTRVMPAELRCFIVHELALSGHANLRDAVPLFLLADDRQLRRTAARALEQTAAPDTMSPETLRRMITVRGWVPEADRPDIDRAIRKAREKGVECASWPAARDLIATASMIDGSGAQSMVLTSPGGGKGVLAGVLLKLGSGLADAWGGGDVSRREINGALRAMRESSETTEVARSYVDAAISNAIARSVRTGGAPGAPLLWIAEAAGGAEWRDRALDVASAAEHMFEALPPEARSAVGIVASLARSGAWIHKDFAESWFIDGDDARAVIKGASGKGDHALRALLETVMPTRRAEWAERFLLLGLRAEAAKDRAQRAMADDFIVLAHELSGDRPLASVPLMAEIARFSVDVARIPRW